MISDVPRCTRSCAATGTEIQPGQTVFSVLQENGGDFRRLDYSVESWKEESKKLQNVVGWWKYKIPVQADTKIKLAPNEILLNFFDQLSDQMQKLEMRYVLTLLLIRRRLFRLEREEDVAGKKKLVVYCSKRDCYYEICTTIPSEEKTEEVQGELAELFSR